ncbi:TetR/AcrR family transcriptional regulator [Bacteroidota bacterium]
MKCKILETAAEMFLNFGFKSVTMDDIAQKMSISKKTIYTHFSNKKILIEETTLGLFHNIKYGIDTIIDKNHNPIEELYEIKNFILINLKDEKSSPQYQLNKYYPKIHASLMQKQFTVMQDCVAKNLQRGIDQGLFRKEIDIDFITRIYFKGMTGIKDLDTFPLDKFKTNYLMESYIDYHIRGLATEKGIQTLEKLKNNK